MAIDFDDDINLVEKEQTILLEPKGDRYVVNHGEGLTAVGFGDHGSLAEKEGAADANALCLLLFLTFVSSAMDN
ncbi:hypothetical protein B296_00044896 [Ensete ventricosum]|uniref:Uncharacterized protein n=1 Tax=Ensete ventricosum TaxID=4639 RepID=A0A426XQ81_ENSVE|nr:hypothetical protein B296_00044896 [Ensete ventricosum]